MTYRLPFNKPSYRIREVAADLGIHNPLGLGAIAAISALRVDN